MKSIIEKSAEEANAGLSFVAAASLTWMKCHATAARGVPRTRRLVNYFGQPYDSPNCGACDICLGDTQDVPDAATVAKKILSCVAPVKEGYGTTHVD